MLRLRAEKSSEKSSSRSARATKKLIALTTTPRAYHRTVEVCITSLQTCEPHTHETGGHQWILNPCLSRAQEQWAEELQNSWPSQVSKYNSGIINPVRSAAPLPLLKSLCA